MRKFRNAFKVTYRSPEHELAKCSKLLRKLEAKAAANDKAAVRIIRLAKKYDSVLQRMAFLQYVLNPVGVR